MPPSAGTPPSVTSTRKKYEIPQEVVAEAIVNAVVHRDYTSNASVQVMLFKDRLEVWNPGSLPPTLTLEQLRGPHASVPHNPLLAEPMYERIAGQVTGQVTGQVAPRVGGRLESRLELRLESDQRKAAMKDSVQPQMTQMNTDLETRGSICANLRNLRLNHFPVWETDNALREILKKIGV